MIGAIVVAGFRQGVGANGQAIFLSGFFYLQVKGGSLGAADFYFFGVANGCDGVAIQILGNFSNGSCGMLAQEF